MDGGGVGVGGSEGFVLPLISVLPIPPPPPPDLNILTTKCH